MVFAVAPLCVLPVAAIHLLPWFRVVDGRPLMGCSLAG